MADSNQYRSTPEILVDGDLNQHDKVDVNNNKVVTQGTELAGEDLNNGVLKVEQRGFSFAISTAATTTVKSGSGFVYKIRVVGGTLGNVTIYDNPAATGTVLLPTVTPVANGVLLENVSFSAGLTIVTAAATVIVGSYR
jgi:hypothetical protein